MDPTYYTAEEAAKRLISRRQNPGPVGALTMNCDQKNEEESISDAIEKLKLQLTPRRDLHIPAPILAKIVSLVSDDGPMALKNWILAGREGIVAVFSTETLSSVKLNRDPLFVTWSRPSHVFYGFFVRCLNQKNPYALYVRSLFLAFQCLQLNEAIELVGTVKSLYPVAELLWIILSSCAGNLNMDVYWEFKKKYGFSEAGTLADSLMYHIYSIGPRRKSTYQKAWYFEDFPECLWEHKALKEANGERCMECIYFYLAKDIVYLS